MQTKSDNDILQTLLKLHMVNKLIAIKKIKFIALNVFIPVLFGGIIYILWRPSSLVMFNWFRLIGLEQSIEVFRMHMGSYANIVPDWVVFSLPNALWVYSFTIAMLLIWHQGKSPVKYLFILLAPISGIGIELGQYFGIIPGVFCLVDLFLCIFTSLLSFAVFHLCVSRSVKFTKEVLL